MPLSTPIDRGHNLGASTSSLSAFTPTANNKLVACAYTYNYTSSLVTPTSPGGGQTWTQVGSVQTFEYISGQSYRMIMWEAVAVASSTTLSTTSTSAPYTALACAEVPGSSASITNYAFATNAAGDPNATLPSAPATSSYVCGFVLAGDLLAMTPGSGFTELWDTATVNGWMFEYRTGTTSTTVNATSSNGPSGIMAFEVAEAAAAAIPPRPFIPPAVMAMLVR